MFGTETAAKLYAVRWPVAHAGVFSTWGECEPLVKGVKGALYQSFDARDEGQRRRDAEAFVAGVDAAGPGTAPADRLRANSLRVPSAQAVGANSLRRRNAQAVGAQAVRRRRAWARSVDASDEGLRVAPTLAFIACVEALVERPFYSLDQRLALAPGAEDAGVRYGPADCVQLGGRFGAEHPPHVRSAAHHRHGGQIGRIGPLSRPFGLRSV